MLRSKDTRRILFHHDADYVLLATKSRKRLPYRRRIGRL
jgi:hypothetical protein